jgi:starch synthase
LADTIEDGVTGFLFDDYTPDALQQAAGRALDLYHQPDAWQHMMRRAMMRGFGWPRSRERYARTYRHALAYHGAHQTRVNSDAEASMCAP